MNFSHSVSLSVFGIVSFLSAFISWLSNVGPVSAQKSYSSHLSLLSNVHFGRKLSCTARNSGFWLHSIVAALDS